MTEFNYNGCLKEKIDVRDYKINKNSSINLPISYLVPILPEVKNQKNVSSCVAHATSSILEDYAKMERVNRKLSTNFIYGIQRQFCNRDGKGMYLRDACKIVKEYGDMIEEHCPGNTEVPEVYKIAEEALKEQHKKDLGYTFRITSYVNLKSNKEIKEFIYTNGPVLASIKWYDVFEIDDDGILYGEEKGDYGYHAIMIYGWNERGFLCQNSWGHNWGKNGRFNFPFEYKIREAKGLVDYENENIIKPKRNEILDIIYKIINFIVNIFRK